MAQRRTPPRDEIEVDPTTGEVVPAGTGIAVVEDEAAVAERDGDMGLADYLMTETAGGEPAPEQAYRMIISQILSAETPEDVLVPVEALSATAMIGRHFQLHGFAVNRSDFEVGSPFYASMTATLYEDDSRVVINTGNQAMLAQLVRLSQLDAFPVSVMIVEGKRPNRHGTKPLRLHIAEAPRRQENVEPSF